ncbi:mechanosensitive ion channel family protein [Cyanobium sp. CH-040]|uniref:mechanosensitive ion channel family protein n=1 Tax=Cyanobium sp. CH-040 TaxID=2823708 RepID=UPI0020CEF6A1|nr:mechanosensitive ion channel family protein [Cyanobium sp. CH-040]MCP9928358.1 mechanosensitive ion channel family protein [Cyanobium sp. CH-040]
MSLPQVWLTAVVLITLLLPLQHLARRLTLPDLPVRLAAAALLAWALVSSLPQGLPPDPYRPWVLIADKLLFSYLGIRLLIWLVLELPPALGWQRPPPQILVQLLMLAGSSLATVIVLRELARFDVVGLVTTSAVLTAVLGLAAQEPLKDLLAGLELQFDDVFKVGDFIQVGDHHLGMVVSVDWHDTCLRDVSGSLVVIPNTMVTEAVVKNFCRFGSMGNRFTIGLDYALPPAQARSLILDVLRRNSRVLSTPAPAVRAESFGESAISYEILVFQRPGNLSDLLELRSELLGQIWYALERNGQSVPYPVRELRPRRTPLDSNHPTRLETGERMALLRHNPLFGALSEEELTSLAHQARCLRFSPGEAVVREGDPGQSLYQLVSGRVEVRKQQKGGEVLSVAQLNPGDIFGEMSLLSGSPRSASVQAIDECVLLKVAQDDIAPLLQGNPGLMDELARLVTARRHQLDDLSTESVQAQENQLLRRMQQIFSTVIW